ncbi:MAG: noncanonical pyrimidine nucleotidase, YjjG family [Odoribacter sp.]|nr:noncanonical pyrimidine nucleotidase, YjjG family [Odoribacter sp.]
MYSMCPYGKNNSLMRKYDHLFFDLDNTLWDFTANSYRAMELTLGQNEILPGLSSFDSYFRVYEQINKSLWNDYHSRKITKQTLIIERFSKSLQAFNISGLDWAELNGQYLGNMALQTELFPCTIETLTTLNARGYQMHIITNGFSEVQRDKLRNSGLAGFFSKIFISEEIHTTKPHRQIFEHALKTTNAKKGTSIMIGDSWETDIEGALEFGIDQIMFLNHGLHDIPDAIKSIQTVPNCTYLVLKHQTRTWFINEIKELIAIL